MADFVMNKEGEYGHLIMQELPEFFNKPTEINTVYKQWGDRCLFIDGNLVPGSFQMNITWYVNVPDFRPLPFHEEHEHEFGELVGFLGSDPNDKYDLGGVIEIGLNGETHRLTRSSVIYMPPGMKHLPMSILELRRPILHFSVVTNPTYTLKRTVPLERNPSAEAEEEGYALGR